MTLIISIYFAFISSLCAQTLEATHLGNPAYHDSHLQQESTENLLEIYQKSFHNDQQRLCDLLILMRYWKFSIHTLRQVRELTANDFHTELQEHIRKLAETPETAGQELVDFLGIYHLELLLDEIKQNKSLDTAVHAKNFLRQHLATHMSHLEAHIGTAAYTQEDMSQKITKLLETPFFYKVFDKITGKKRRKLQSRFRAIDEKIAEHFNETHITAEHITHDIDLASSFSQHSLKPAWTKLINETFHLLQRSYLISALTGELNPLRQKVLMAFSKKISSKNAHKVLEKINLKAYKPFLLESTKACYTQMDILYRIILDQEAYPKLPTSSRCPLRRR